MDIKVLVDSGLAQPLPDSRLRELAEQILVAQGIDPDTELTLVVTNQDKLRELSRDSSDKSEPSAVLAFTRMPTQVTPENEAFLVPKSVWQLGVVVVSYPQAAARAEQCHSSLEKELAGLITRGVLNLVGYDDSPEQQDILSAKAAEILNCLDVD